MRFVKVQMHEFVPGAISPSDTYYALINLDEIVMIYKSHKHQNYYEIIFSTRTGLEYVNEAWAAYIMKQIGASL